MAGVNLEAVQPGRCHAAEHSAFWRLSKSCPEFTESDRISGRGNARSLKCVHLVTMRPERRQMEPSRLRIR
jgi:hypothetical protein